MNDTERGDDKHPEAPASWGPVRKPQPGEVEAIVDSTADEVDDPIGRLCGREVSLGLGVRRVHDEAICPGMAVQCAAFAVGQQFSDRPGLATVFTQRGKHALPFKFGARVAGESRTFRE